MAANICLFLLRPIFNEACSFERRFAMRTFSMTARDGKFFLDPRGVARLFAEIIKLGHVELQRKYDR